VKQNQNRGETGMAFDEESVAQRFKNGGTAIIIMAKEIQRAPKEEWR